MMIFPLMRFSENIFMTDEKNVLQTKIFEKKSFQTKKDTLPDIRSRKACVVYCEGCSPINRSEFIFLKVIFALIKTQWGHLGLLDKAPELF